MVLLSRLFHHSAFFIFWIRFFFLFFSSSLFNTCGGLVFAYLLWTFFYIFVSLKYSLIRFKSVRMIFILIECWKKKNNTKCVCVCVWHSRKRNEKAKHTAQMKLNKFMSMSTYSKFEWMELKSRKKCSKRLMRCIRALKIK